MEHPTISLAVAKARQADIERELSRPERLARREFELDLERSDRPSRWLALARRIARLRPVARHRASAPTEPLKSC